jgi:tetratricopeptide (TPR) repeat protein
LAWCCCASLAWAESPSGEVSDAEPIASLGDVPKLEGDRDEAAADLANARAYFAHARMLQQRRDSLGALRHYQRAYRYDPQHRGLKEIVSLAAEMGRLDEAARYAAEGGANVKDVILLRRLATEATSRRDWAIAAKLYEASLVPAGSEEAKSALQVLMRAELGRLYFLTDQFAKSAAMFGEVRQALAQPDAYNLGESLVKTIVGDDRETYSLMAQAALEAQLFDEAVQLAHEAFPEESQRDRLELLLARITERRGQERAAVDQYAVILARGGDRAAVAGEALRRLLTKLEGEAAGEKLFGEKILAAHVAHPQAEALRTQYIQSLIGRRRFAEAESLLELDEQLRPTPEQKLLLASIYRQRGDGERWLGQVAAAWRLAADEVASEVHAAARDHDFAEQVLTSIERTLNAADQPARRAVAALVALEIGKYLLAVENWNESLPDDEAARVRSLVTLGLKLTRLEQYELATDLFRRVIADHPQSADAPIAQFYLAGAAALAGQYDVAIEAARQAAAAKPGDIRFATREAWALQMAKRYAESRSQYEQALKRFERSSESAIREELRQSRLVLANACDRLGDHSAACEQMEQVLDEFPGDAGALNDLAYLWADRSLHLQRALGMVQRAIAAEPENRAFRDTLGWVYYRLGRFQEAAAELEKACAGDSPAAVVLEHWGDALSASGKPDDARTAWHRAAEAHRREGDAAKADAAEAKQMTKDE